MEVPESQKQSRFGMTMEHATLGVATCVYESAVAHNMQEGAAMKARLK